MLVEVDHMDLNQIADSGQCFRMKKLDDEGKRYKVYSLSREVEVCEVEKGIFDFSCSEEEYDRVWRDYFDIDTNYNYLDSLIPKDDVFLQASSNYGKGMRILKQNLWEASVSFVISQNNNIPRIKKIIESLCYENDGNFPYLDEIGSVLERVDIGLGYREKYLFDLADFFKEYNTEDLYEMSYVDQMNILMKVRGIGGKVANCICLYGLHTFDACPVDVWVERLVNEEYGGVTPDWMYSDYAGYYQQLCFYYKRHKSGVIK